MKKILVVLFTTTLILSTSGCNVDKTNSTSIKNTNETMNEADVASSTHRVSVSAACVSQQRFSFHKVGAV